MIHYITDLVTVIITIAAAIAAIKSAKSAKRSYEATRTLILKELIDDYKSPQMMYALRRLRDIYKKAKNDKEKLKQLYERQYYKDNLEIENTCLEQKINKVQGTLDFQRRYLAAFYSNLELVDSKKVIPEDYMTSFFKPADYSIIPDILVPMEKMVPTFQGEPEIKLIENDDYPPLKLYNRYNDIKVANEKKKNKK
jgi:hypothetical protein